MHTRLRHVHKCTVHDTDTRSWCRQRGAVPTAPPPDWVIDRRRAIGDHIRAVRREVRPRLSQEKLADLAGMDRQAINRIEQGHQSPLLDNLIRIADALNVPLADLVR